MMMTCFSPKMTLGFAQFKVNKLFLGITISSISAHDFDPFSHSSLELSLLQREIQEEKSRLLSHDDGNELFVVISDLQIMSNAIERVGKREFNILHIII
jgi:hypothetical protein